MVCLRNAGVGVLTVVMASGAALAGDGPDALNGGIFGFANFATGETNAVAFGVSICNVGNAQLDVVANTNEHPITTHNLYRVDGEGITQLGVSWVSHRFCALQQNLCDPCTPAGGVCPPVLGVGCSDVTSATFEGVQSNLSSRSTVNASTAEFQYPFPPATGDALFKRLQYSAEDAIPVQNPGARYFAESITLAPDDDASGNDGNNASFREVLMDDDGRIQSLTGATVRGLPAVFAWQEVDASVRIEQTDIPSDGRVYVASDAHDNGDGTWTYTYSVMNLNSHESVRAVMVPTAVNADAGSASFSDVDYHSGDPYDGTDWGATVDASGITWSTETIGQNANANAIRWATAYRFSFVSPDPPADGTVELLTFRSGLSVSVGAIAPEAVTTCPGDCDMSGAVEFGDLVCLLGLFGEVPSGSSAPEDCDGSGSVSFADLVCTLGNFGPCVE